VAPLVEKESCHSDPPVDDKVIETSNDTPVSILSSNSLDERIDQFMNTMSNHLKKMKNSSMLSVSRLLNKG